MRIKQEIGTGSSRLTDLVYADDDDVVFFIQSASDAADCLSIFTESSSILGMHMSTPTTKLHNLDIGHQLTGIYVQWKHS